LLFEQTIYRSAVPACLRKEDFFSHTPVYMNHAVVDTVYSTETALSHFHTHDFVEISIVVDGKGIHSTLGQTIECNTGDVYIINEGAPHAYFANSDGDCPVVCNLVFDPKDILDGKYARYDHPEYCYGVFRENGMFAYMMLTSKMMNDMTDLLESMEKELAQREYQWEQALKAYLANFLILASRYIAPLKIVQSSQANKQHRLTASIMRSALDQYSNPDLTLQHLAEALFVSASSAGRAFRQTTGENFGDYIRRIRLENAIQLLTETELSNEQIVKACGFRDVPNFYRLFKKHTGMTPFLYRRVKRNETRGISLNQRNISYAMMNKGDKMMSILTEISENLQKGKAKIVAELVQTALEEGVTADAILNEGLLAGMNVIGEKFKNNEVYVPEVLVAARAMNKGTAILKPHLAAAGVQATGKVCIGTVQGDLHDIGKNLVKMMLEGKGLEVVDLGTDVSPETFVQTAIEQNCQVICCSALLTTTMGVMEDVVKKAVELGVRDKVKIMIGGAPVNEDYCQKIGADLYTPDAASAADAAVEFCKG